jgi:hypothetical protein
LTTFAKVGGEKLATAQEKRDGALMLNPPTNLMPKEQ